MAQKKIGRPKSENPLTDKIHVLLNEDSRIKLEKCKEVLELNTSDVVRKGIDKVYDDLDKK